MLLCIQQDPKYNALASEYNPANPHLQHFIALAMELHVVLPISFYEVANNVYFNSLTVINADGELLGLYRKSHIPDGPGYQEKFYFSPGDTGFKVFRTTFGVIGVAICWDQVRSTFHYSVWCCFVTVTFFFYQIGVTDEWYRDNVFVVVSRSC